MNLEFRCESVLVKGVAGSTDVRVEISNPVEGFLNQSVAEDIVFHSNKNELIDALFDDNSEHLLSKALSYNNDSNGYCESFLNSNKDSSSIAVFIDRLKLFLKEAKEVVNDQTEIEIHGGNVNYQRDLIIKDLFNHIYREIKNGWYNRIRKSIGWTSKD